MLQLKLKDMEAKELMIGDWVKATYTEIDNNENEHKCYTYCKVSSIGDDGTFVGTDKCFSVQVFDDVDVESLEEAKPIPLTKEILEKNGATIISQSWESTWYRLCGCVDVLSKDIEHTLHIRVAFYEFELKYVHQLQHALRLCGLTELSDNFKL